MTGSANWTANAVQANDENLLIVHDTGLARAYAADFERLQAAIAPGGFVCNQPPPPTATPTPGGAPICTPGLDRCGSLPIVVRPDLPEPTTVRSGSKGDHGP